MAPSDRFAGGGCYLSEESAMGPLDRFAGGGCYLSEETAMAPLDRFAIGEIDTRKQENQPESGVATLGWF